MRGGGGTRSGLSGGTGTGDLGVGVGGAAPPSVVGVMRGSGWGQGAGTSPVGAGGSVAQLATTNVESNPARRARRMGVSYHACESWTGRIAAWEHRHREATDVVPELQRRGRAGSGFLHGVRRADRAGALRGGGRRDTAAAGGSACAAHGAARGAARDRSGDRGADGDGVGGEAGATTARRGARARTLSGVRRADDAGALPGVRDQAARRG